MVLGAKHHVGLTFASLVVVFIGLIMLKSYTGFAAIETQQSNLGGLSLISFLVLGCLVFCEMERKNL